MNTKWSIALALGAVASSAFAQQGPPPSGRPGGGGAGISRPAPQAQTSTNTTPETIRLLTLSNVQNDLGLSLAQWTGLNDVVRSLKGTSVTEDAALSAVAKVLTPTQIVRLKELMVQDLGYGSLSLADVRAQLSLTADQAKSISAVLATLDSAKKALAATLGAQKATADLQTQTNAQLAKLLTSEQDAKLRSLAGRAIGAKA